jgi:hypothetical protein
MDKLNIAVFGDSFADREMDSKYMYPDREDESWMNVLEDAGHRVTTFGRGGTSTWFSYENFIDHHKFYDAVIFCYSCHERIHILPEGLQSYSSVNSCEDLKDMERVKTLPKQKQEELYDVIKGMHLTKNLLFNIFVLGKIFEDINFICQRNNIKLVNILSFENKKTTNRFNFKASHGDVLYNLIPIVMKEMDSGSATDNRFCHLSLENNQVLGNIILDSLNDRPRKFVDLASEGNFIYSPEITERYKKLL